MVSNKSTKLNTVQLHLLKVFAKNSNENDLSEIKVLLSNYYAKKVDIESDKIWDKKGLNDEDIENLLNTHIRIPNK